MNENDRAPYNANVRITQKEFNLNSDQVNTSNSVPVLGDKFKKSVSKSDFTHKEPKDSDDCNHDNVQTEKETEHGGKPQNVETSSKYTEKTQKSTLEKMIVFGDKIKTATLDDEIADGDKGNVLRRIRSLKKIKGRLVCVIGEDYSYALAQEPWPKDVKLYQPYEVEQILLPDNANCLAVQAFLRMCNLEFEVVSRANAEFMSPSGKVPFIKCGAFIVSELEGIVQFVNNKGISLTSNLEPEQKSDMRAYMSLIHNVLENAELYLCWCDKETYNEVTKPRNGSVYPWPLNHFQTWSKKSNVCRRLKIMGWYDKTLEDIYQEVETCCQALTDRLEGKEYFFGKRCTELDALIYGHIYSILTFPLPTDDNKLAYIVQKYIKLVEHTQKIHNLVKEEAVSFVISTYSMMKTSTKDTPFYIDAELTDELRATDTEEVTLEELDADPFDINFDDLKAGEFPTELDALIFGHLFTILTTPLPNNQLANIVRNYPALINLVQRVERSYFKRETPQ